MKKKKNKERIKCASCSTKTDDFYIMKTNTGNIYKCSSCYETELRRKIREEYYYKG